MVHISVVLDRSGSMSRLWQDSIGGLGQFIEDQQKLPGEVEFSLAVFDDKYNLLTSGTPLQEVDINSLLEGIFSRGTTALYDAVGKTITTLGQNFQVSPPDKVIMAIITDGFENSSQEYSLDSVKALIKQQTNEWGWEFMYFGSDITTHGAAKSIGIPTSVKFDATSVGTRRAYASYSTSVSNLRTEK